MNNRLRTLTLLAALLTSGSQAADINVTIPWQVGTTFTTNINVYGTTLGYSKTLRITPETCYRFKGTPTRTSDRLTVVNGTINNCEANYTMTLTSTNLQGWIQVSGEIEPGNDCGGTCGGGGSGAADQDFDVTVTQRVAWAYYTVPSNHTNLTCCGGTTNEIESKVVLGDAGVPSAGTLDFSASPSTLGTFTANSISISPSGTAATSFIASTNGDAGTITANASGLKDEAGKDVPSVSSNLTVQVVNADLIEVYKTNTVDWTSSDKLPWNSIIFRGTDLKFKITLNTALEELSDFQCLVQARTFSSSTDTEEWKTISINGDDTLSEDKTEIRMNVTGSEVISLGLLPSSGSDSVEEYSSSDSKDTSTGPSNDRDSNKFDDDMTAASRKRRGKGRDAGNINASPPKSAHDKDFMSAAGVVYLEIRVTGRKSEIRQLQNQADWFYISTHGNHANGKLGGDIFGASDAKWGEDLNKVFIAGCSVLDINDYNDHYTGSEHNASPGEVWAGTGPTILFGYNWKAPLDDNLGNPDFTANIINGYTVNRGNGENENWSWGKANKDMATEDADEDDELGQRPYNCCIIDLSTNPAEYWYFNLNGVWTRKTQNEW